MLCPDDISELKGGIGSGVDLLLELHGLVHLIDAVAVDVELPAVVDAAEAALFVPAEPEGGAAVGAELVEEADAPVGVTEGDEAFAEEPHPDGRTVRLRQLPGEEGRHPVPSHDLTHGGPWAGAGQ